MKTILKKFLLLICIICVLYACAPSRSASSVNSSTSTEKISLSSLNGGICSVSNSYTETYRKTQRPTNSYNIFGSLAPYHNKVVAAFYPNWGMYERDFQVYEIPVDKLTHIFYAYAKLSTVELYEKGAVLLIEKDGNLVLQKDENSIVYAKGDVPLIEKHGRMVCAINGYLPYNASGSPQCWGNEDEKNPLTVSKADCVVVTKKNSTIVAKPGDLIFSDPNADTQKSFTGDSNCWKIPSGTISYALNGTCGNLNQLKILKAKNPHLKIILLIGGYSFSQAFADTMGNLEYRTNFYNSAKALMTSYDYIDGIDISWAYPNGDKRNNDEDGKGAYTPNINDSANFLEMLRALRKDPFNGTSKTLSITISANPTLMNKIDLATIYKENLVDWINVLNFDYHGSWEGEKLLGHHNGLYQADNFLFAKNIYSNSGRFGDNLKLNIDSSVAILNEKGIPSNKIIIGIAAYGKTSSNTEEFSYKKGTIDYKDVAFKKILPLSEQKLTSTNVVCVQKKGSEKGVYYDEIWDDTAKESVLVSKNGGTISYVSTSSIREKAKYIQKKDLKGAFLMSLDSDSIENNNSLINTLDEELRSWASYIKPSKTKLEELLPKAKFEEIFHSPLSTEKAALCNGYSLYNYDGLVEASRFFPMFLSSSDDNVNKKELAAFLANISHETNAGTDTSPGGKYLWGLCHKEEGGASPVRLKTKTDSAYRYCNSSSSISSSNLVCSSNETISDGSVKYSYFGRGPIQLSWNYNYYQAGLSLGIGTDLLYNPDLVISNSALSFKTALWFWMTAQHPKPSCHTAITSTTTTWENPDNSRVPGFGMTINIINGGKECGIYYTTTPEASRTDKYSLNRIDFYNYYLGILGVTDPDSTTRKQSCQFIKAY